MRRETASALAALLLVIALALAMVGQKLLYAPQPASTPLFAGAVIAAVAAWILGRDRVKYESPDSAFGSGNSLRWSLAGAALLSVALTTVLARPSQDWPVAAPIAWVSGFFLASWAVRGWVVTAPARQSPGWSHAEIWGVGTVIVLASAVRVVWLDTLPLYYFGDEARIAEYLRDAYAQGIPNFFTMGWNTWPIVGLSLQALFAPWLGLSITALRLSSALMGTLAVLSTYLLARELFSVRLALVAALLFAVMRTAIEFSRLGICHAQVMLFETLALMWWWRGVNSGSAASYLWAGIALGWCLYTYNAGQLVPLLWLGWIVLAIALAPRASTRYAKGAALTGAGFVLAVFPWLFHVTDAFQFGRTWERWTIMARDRQTLSRMLDAWSAGGMEEGAKLLGHQIKQTWLGFLVAPDDSYGLSYRGGGMLDDVTAPLFVLGLTIAVVRLKHARHCFLLWWWLITAVAGGVLTIQPPAYVRMVGLLPVLAILAASPLDSLVRFVRGARLPGAVGWSLVTALLVGAAWNNGRTYFVEFAQARIDPSSELARQLEPLPSDATVLLSGAEHFLHFNGKFHVHFVNELFTTVFPGRRFLDVPDPAHLIPLREPARSPLVIVLGPTQITSAELIRALYANTTVSQSSRGSDEPSFRVLRIDPRDLLRTTGLELMAYDSTGAVLDKSVADPFTPRHAPARIHRAHWSGSIYWPTDQPATVGVNGGGPVAIHVAGLEPIRTDGHAAAEVSATLMRGWHPIEIQQVPARMPPLSITIQSRRLKRSLARWDFRPDRTLEGLTAIYSRNGQPLLRTIDPQLNSFAVEDRFGASNDLPVRMPFSATWEGSLVISTPGSYEFEVHASGPFSIELGGVELMAGRQVNPEEPVVQRHRHALTAGEHAVRVQWDSSAPAHTLRRIFQVFWTRPDGTRELIPPANFRRAG
jgi:4-amino-4-deoxy-L-arabinose transferase-like glycosyltransferase